MLNFSKLRKGYSANEETWFPFVSVLAKLFGFEEAPVDENGQKYMVMALEQAERRLILVSTQKENAFQIKSFFALDASNVPSIETIFSIARELNACGFAEGCESVRATAREKLAVLAKTL